MAKSTLANEKKTKIWNRNSTRKREEREKQKKEREIREREKKVVREREARERGPFTSVGRKVASLLILILHRAQGARRVCVPVYPCRVRTTPHIHTHIHTHTHTYTERAEQSTKGVLHGLV